jgi:hypothetical protein
MKMNIVWLGIIIRHSLRFYVSEEHHVCLSVASFIALLQQWRWIALLQQWHCIPVLLLQFSLPCWRHRPCYGTLMYSKERRFPVLPNRCPPWLWAEGPLWLVRACTAYPSHQLRHQPVLSKQTLCHTLVCIGQHFHECHAPSCREHLLSQLALVLPRFINTVASNNENSVQLYVIRFKFI